MTDKLIQIIHEDKQIIEPKQIIPGRTYITKYKSPAGKIIEVAEHTITGIDLEAREFYTALSVNPKIRNIHSMSDYGLFPDENGNWNRTNWLVLKAS